MQIIPNPEFRIPNLKNYALISVFRFIIEHTMAESLKIRVCYLVTELFAHTAVFFGALQSAWAIAARSFQSLFYFCNYLCIIVEFYCHCSSSRSFGSSGSSSFSFGGTYPSGSCSFTATSSFIFLPSAENIFSCSVSKFGA